MDFIQVLHHHELTLIQWVHQFRTPLLDHFFKFLDYFDRPEFFFILLPIVWLCHGWKVGLRLFSLLFLSQLLNHTLKEFFHSPRPFHLDSTVEVIQVSGFGFPSGAAQTVILLSALLITFWKSPWRWAVVFPYILLVSFSRIYLGVHFPTDILGGWLVGFGLWSLYIYAAPPLENLMARLSPKTLFLLCQTVPLTLLLWQYSPPILRVCGVAMGIGVGLFLIHLFKFSLSPPKNKREYLFRALIGILTAFLCYGLTFLFSTSNLIIDVLIPFFLIGFAVSFGSHYLCYYYYRRGINA